MGKNLFDDVDGKYTLSKNDFKMERYHNKFGYAHVDADGPWEETPFKRKPNKITEGL